jgi:hypothetical protein
MVAQITCKRFVAGIVLIDDVVTSTAPIVRFMRGHTSDWVRTYCKRWGWQIRIVKNPHRRGVISPQLIIEL